MDASKELRNEIATKTRKAEGEHVKRKIYESKGDVKKHWQILRSTISKTNNKQDVTSEFLYKGKWVKDVNESANNFNFFLANV